MALKTMRAAAGFGRGILTLRSPWLVWVGVLAGLNAVAPLVYLRRIEGQAVLAAALAAAVLQLSIYRRLGFVRLLGAGHVAWFALLPWLWHRAGAAAADSRFGLWLFLVIACDGFSLLVDTVDVIRYAAGDRTPAAVYGSRREVGG